MHAFESAPLVGHRSGQLRELVGGPRHARESVRNAHSLYAETLAELGLVGIALLLGADRADHDHGRTRRPPSDRTAAGASRRRHRRLRSVRRCGRRRLALAGDGPARLLPAARRRRPRAREGKSTTGRRGAEGGSRSSGLSVVALVGLGVPLAGATQLRSSQQAAAANQLDPALHQASTSRRVQPFASSPLLQRALVLELRGDLAGAASAAQAAERKEPTNWRPPFVLARIEAERGNVNAGLAALRRARALNKTARLPAMTPDDFEPGIPADEREQLERLASRLVADRPVPRPAFRGELRRSIVRAPRPRRMRLRVVAYLVSGAALLAISALGVNDVGPLAPHAGARQGAVQAQVSAR